MIFIHKKHCSKYSFRTGNTFLPKIIYILERLFLNVILYEFVRIEFQNCPYHISENQKFRQIRTGGLLISFNFKIKYTHFVSWQLGRDLSPA